MKFLRSTYHYLLAWFGSGFYKHPSRKLFVIGVTGTKGKSTVIELINAILESAGKKTAVISSVRFKNDLLSFRNLTGMTMPGRFLLQKLLSEAVQSGCDYAIIEVTSQGILQHRHRFIDFNSVLLTNLEPEHIEAHGSYENYRESKVKFFLDAARHSLKKPKFFFINSEVKDKDYFLKAAEGKGKIIFFEKSDIRKMKIKTKLLGEFNLENIAAAIAFARSQNIDWDTIRSAIETFDGVPGRLEFVQKIPFSVIIDYAHTPDSLEKVYQTLKSQKSKIKSQKLICVLGAAGGGRDVWKRPVMGEIASKYCDQIILTNEDPFDEDPNQILSEIKSGITKTQFPISKVNEIIDRKAAIKKAIQSAEKGDTVIITGKGSEPYLRVANGKKIPWNEREIVLRILNNERIEI
ncbi:MAG: UDP-N-acetylmuramoyl-L-alanyl-D-glutamate--2,6-diaminopimelate ligase [Candidatus Harrisonbacteria bacterium]|nr:UDP-N-acetylmuramoyl-L-alanyl-D-glutamate--2,6-diaminopimelate ligase [Candidatus Harrisonbacteria bacterium]